jgi:Ca-activated chloride channel family protein
MAMTWHAPELLWLLLGLPLLGLALFIGFRLRQRAAHSFGSEPSVRRLIKGRSAGLRAARAVVVLLGVGCAVVALARPQYGSRTRMLRKRGVDVVIALDFSKSMLARDVRPSRIERAKAEVTAFLNELGGDRVGIVAFAGETMEFPMTVDYGAAALFFRDLGPYDMPVGGTAIGRALTAARRLLERSSRSTTNDDPNQRSRLVILMTDGEDHEGDPVAAASELAKIGARVYVVGIGTRTGEPIPTYADDGTWTGYLRDASGNSVLTSLSSDNEAQLKKIAAATGGKYIAAGRGSVGMNQIRVEMRRMKQGELKARKITVHEERYASVLLFSFLLILLEALLPEAWFERRLKTDADVSSAANQTAKQERAV